MDSTYWMIIQVCARLFSILSFFHLTICSWPPTDLFTVLHQSSSPRTIASETGVRTVEPLYCVASGHNLRYRYTWDNIIGVVGINSRLLRFWAGYLSLYCDEWEWWTNLLTVHCYQRRYIFSLLVSTKCIGKKLRIENTHHLFRCTSFQSTDQCIIFFLMHHSRFVVSQILPGRH